MDQTIVPAMQRQRGYYQLTLTYDGIHLTVFPPIEGGEAVLEDTVLQDLAKRRITDFDTEKVSATVAEASGEAIRIGDPIVPEIRVMVQRDRLAAMIDVTTPPGSLMLTQERLRDSLKAAGIVYGVDERALEWLLKSRGGKNILCASGTPAREGDSAFIKYHVDIEGQGRPVELEDGTVDFKNINNFINVVEGELLLEKIPATAGTPGTDVLGLPIPAKYGKDTPMPVGKNMTVVDQCRLISNIDGQLQIVGRRINVLPTIEVPGDVDYSTGHIDFIGNVIVRGSVQPGFSIKAGGNVEIRGAISGGMVEASNIIVRMGIQGMGTSIIKARERIVAKFVENATVFADQEIVVSDVVLHSFLYAGLRVIVEGKRGLVIGGRISAGEEIRARTVGNRADVSSDLEVAVNPFLKDELGRLQIENKKSGAVLEDLTRCLTYMRQQGIDHLNEEKRKRYDAMEAQYNEFPEHMEELQQRMEDIQKILREMKPGKIRISDILYPGTKVFIGVLTKIITDPFKYLCLYAHEGEIKFSPFR